MVHCMYEYEQKRERVHSFLARYVMSRLTRYDKEAPTHCLPHLSYMNNIFTSLVWCVTSNMTWRNWFYAMSWCAIGLCNWLGFTWPDTSREKEEEKRRDDCMPLRDGAEEYWVTLRRCTGLNCLSLSLLTFSTSLDSGDGLVRTWCLWKEEKSTVFSRLHVTSRHVTGN